MASSSTRRTRRFELKVAGHGRELTQRLDSARKRRRFCDFMIQVGGMEIHAHRVVLCEGSDYFQELFSRRDDATNSHAVTLDGIDPDCFLLCIEYLYTGQISVPGEQCLELFLVANMLMLRGLCDKISSFIESALDLDSFYEVQKVARIPGLDESCVRFATRNFRSIVVSDRFMHMDKDFVLKLIGAKGNKEEESIKCKALMIWGNFDGYNRKDAVEEMFLTLNLGKIPRVYLQYLGESEPLVFNSIRCMRKLFGAMSEMEKDVHQNPSFQETSSNWFALRDPWPEKFVSLQPREFLQGSHDNKSEIPALQASAANDQSPTPASEVLLSSRFKTLQKMMDFCLDVTKVNVWRISISHKSQRIWDKIFENLDIGVLVYSYCSDRKNLEEFAKNEKLLMNGKEWELSKVPKMGFENPAVPDGQADHDSVCSESGKLWPGFVIWFDNETLQLFAKNFCDVEIKFHSSLGIFPDSQFKIVAKGEVSAIFSIAKFVELLKKKSDIMFRLDGFDITAPHVMIDAFTISINPCVIYRFTASSSALK